MKIWKRMMDIYLEYGVILKRHREEEDGHYIERLCVAFTVCLCKDKILMLEDRKGVLNVTWRGRPNKEEMKEIAFAWQVAGEPKENVIHLVVVPFEEEQKTRAITDATCRINDDKEEAVCAIGGCGSPVECPNFAPGSIPASFCELHGKHPPACQAITKEGTKCKREPKCYYGKGDESRYCVYHVRQENRTAISKSSIEFFQMAQGVSELSNLCKTHK